MPLSEFEAKKAKAGEKPYKMFDGGGLYLHVMPTGSKLWKQKYRFNKKEKVLSFGKYPTVGISQARKLRDEAKEKIAEGIDPSVEKRLAKIAAENASRQTFGLIAEEYIQNLEANGAADATIKKTQWLLLDLASPLSTRPIKDISAAEILHLLKRVEETGRRETAKRLRGTIGSVFRLAIVTLRAETDPTTALQGALLAPKTKGRSAITSEAKLGALLRAIDSYDGWPVVSYALNFLMLTCVRPGEVRGAVKGEFDLENAKWEIPAERMKMRQPHSVPLSKQALEILEKAFSLPDNSRYVFPSLRSRDRPLSDNSFNAALRRMGYTKEEVTAHGFRVSASSILNNRGIDGDVVEAILAHQDKNVIRRTYNRATYWDQRKEVMQQWADLLDEFRKR